MKFDKIGVGLIIGEPFGISGKMWLSKEMAFDAALAVSTSRPFYAHADYLLHNYELIKSLMKDAKIKTGAKEKEENTPFFYYGAGAYVSYGSNGSIGLGARLPVGLEYMANPFDIFLELVPVFSLTPSMGLALSGGLGVRFNF